jgi:hypothetical protein
MTTTLEGGEGSVSRSGCSLTPWKRRYSLYRRLGGPHSRSGQVRKISPPPGFDPRTVQLIASRYTDYATRPIRTYVVPKKNEHILVLKFLSLLGTQSYRREVNINPSKAELNPICHLLTLLRAHLIFHFSRIRVKGQWTENFRQITVFMNSVVNIKFR